MAGSALPAYTNWAAGEPDNADGVDQRNAIIDTAGEWHDSGDGSLGLGSTTNRSPSAVWSASSVSTWSTSRSSARSRGTKGSKTRLDEKCCAPPGRCRVRTTASAGAMSARPDRKGLLRPRTGDRQEYNYAFRARRRRNQISTAWRLTISPVDARRCKAGKICDNGVERTPERQARIIAIPDGGGGVASFHHILRHPAALLHRLLRRRLLLHRVPAKQPAAASAGSAAAGRLRRGPTRRRRRPDAAVRQAALPDRAPTGAHGRGRAAGWSSNRRWSNRVGTQAVSRPSAASSNVVCSAPFAAMSLEGDTTQRSVPSETPVPGSSTAQGVHTTVTNSPPGHSLGQPRYGSQSSRHSPSTRTTTMRATAVVALLLGALPGAHGVTATTFVRVPEDLAYAEARCTQGPRRTGRNPTDSLRQ